MTATFGFEVCAQDWGVRRGTLRTPHGSVATPAFMPVATQGAVKALDPATVRAIGTDMLLANSYHLYLRPGTDVVAAAGGLHRFMSWDGPILTDSGGFQVMSLAALVGIDDRGVSFQSHIDGSHHRFTPRDIMEIEADLGADFITPLDQCLAYPHDRAGAEAALDRTMDWLEESVLTRRRSDQWLFGIVQGGVFLDLRRDAASRVAEMNTDGIAIGGMCVGEPRSTTLEVLTAVSECLPPGVPRYVMGVGSPELLAAAAGLGYDMFDCVLPTRLARHATVLTSRGALSLRRSEYGRDMSPPDPDCECSTCARFSRAYLRHLFKAGEILALQLATVHNLHFIQGLMRQIRNVQSQKEWDDLTVRISSLYPVAG